MRRILDVLVIAALIWCATVLTACDSPGDALTPTPLAAVPNSIGHLPSQVDLTGRDASAATQVPPALGEGSSGGDDAGTPGGPAMPPPGGTGCPPNDPADCPDFACQPRAQSFFLALQRTTGQRDCADLDRDRDGIACNGRPATCP